MMPERETSIATLPDHLQPLAWSAVILLDEAQSEANTPHIGTQQHSLRYTDAYRHLQAVWERPDDHEEEARRQAIQRSYGKTAFLRTLRFDRLSVNAFPEGQLSIALSHHHDRPTGDLVGGRHVYFDTHSIMLEKGSGTLTTTNSLRGNSLSTSLEGEAMQIFEHRFRHMQHVFGLTALRGAVDERVRISETDTDQAIA